MNTESREHLSSLIDGEVSKETGRFLLRRLGADGALRETWARYHLIRDCLRYQEGQIAQQDLSGRVRMALSNEPSIPVRALSARTWLKPLAGVAVAASVALMAVLAVSGGNGSGALPGASELAGTVAAEPFTSPNIGAMFPVSQPVNLSGSSGQENQKMNTYLLRHYQVTGEAGGKGFVSFVPIIVTRAPVVGEPGDELQPSDDADGEASLR